MYKRGQGVDGIYLIRHGEFEITKHFDMRKVAEEFWRRQIHSDLN